MFAKIKDMKFLFSELVKRDFKKKYKRTYLGMLWSVFSPLLTLLVMRIVFTKFFGESTEHYTTYLFCGNIIFSFFSEATGSGMASLLDNSSIFTKINIPKYLFLFSRNVSSLINFALTFAVFLLFTAIDGVAFTPKFLLLAVPIAFLTLFNLGLGLILSSMFVFFRDVQYLWSIFTMLLMYMSAIFYTTDSYSPTVRALFHLNPVYVYIKYFRCIVLESRIPGIIMHSLTIGYALFFFTVGAVLYKKCNNKFLYYV